MMREPERKLWMDLYRAASEQAAAPGEHVIDDEGLLAAWADGQVNDEERERIETHLADCGPCRTQVAELVKCGVLQFSEAGEQALSDQGVGGRAIESVIIDEDAPVILRPKVWFGQKWSFALAAAASVLIAVGVGLWRMNVGEGPESVIAQAERDLTQGRALAATERLERLLKQSGLPEEQRQLAKAALARAGYQAAKEDLTAGKFDAVAEIGKRLNKLGVKSSRLNSLTIQARLGVREEITLSEGGRLTNYGFDLDGGVSREPNGPDPDKLDKAAAEYAELVKENPQDGTLLVNYGNVLLLRKEPDEAMKMFAKAIVVNRHDLNAHLGLGLAEYAKRDYETALREFQFVLDREPTRTDALINAAMTLERLHRKGEAVPLWKAALPGVTDPALKEQIANRVGAEP